MNFVKRAFRNLVYKKAYNILLILLFTVLATIVLSGFAIRKASVQSCIEVRRKLGGTVTM
jgi:putative ABC transport system permease protein